MALTRRLALLASLASAPLAGCVSTKADNLLDLKPSPVSTTSSVSGSSPESDLPTREQAALAIKMAESLERENKESDALIYYERARQLDPSLNDRAARRLAILYDRHDQQAKGMSEFQQLLAKHPKDASLLNDVGYSFYNRGNWAEAESYLRRATVADKNHKRAWINLGMTLGQQGKYEEAFAAFSKAVSPAEAHANLGFILAQQPNRRAEAIGAYRQALAIEPALTVAQKALQRLEAANSAIKSTPDVKTLPSS